MDNRTPHKQHHLFVQESAVPRAKTFPGNHPGPSIRAKPHRFFSRVFFGFFFHHPSQSWWAIPWLLSWNGLFFKLLRRLVKKQHVDAKICENACMMYKLQDIWAHLTVHEKYYCQNGTGTSPQLRWGGGGKVYVEFTLLSRMYRTQLEGGVPEIMKKNTCKIQISWVVGTGVYTQVSWNIHLPSNKYRTVIDM